MYDLYTQEIEQLVLKYGLSVHIYADDVQIYFCFDTGSQSVAENNLKECMNEISRWMKESFLKLNEEKTKIKIFNPMSLCSPSFHFNSGCSIYQSFPYS